jgi:GxxExxY protein
MNADGRGLKHGELSGKVLRVFFNVYNELGYGFLEAVYGKAMTMALTEVGLRVDCGVAIPVWFRGEQIGDYWADLFVENALILELKACRALEPAHEAQLLNYLRATEIEVGLLLNFGPKPQFKRMASDNDRKQIRVHPRSSAAKPSGGT